MNKKILGSGVAIVAAVGLLGGGTFAAWSDWDAITGNTSGADHLTLDLGGSGVEGFSNVKLAPGVGVERQFVVASRQGETVPGADLYLTLDDLEGVEDGCRGNSEEADQLDLYGTSCDAQSEQYDAAGQFIAESHVFVNTTVVPTTDVANACASTPHNRGSRVHSTSLADLAAGDRINLLHGGRTLGAGQGICVAVEIRLPQDATNASQGDSASFDLRFDLEQAFPTS